jgi:hypothetical protein
VTLPSGLAWLQPVIRHGVTPAVLAVATVLLVVLTVRSRSSGRQVLSGDSVDRAPTATKAL